MPTGGPLTQRLASNQITKDSGACCNARPATGASTATTTTTSSSATSATATALESKQICSANVVSVSFLGMQPRQKLNIIGTLNIDKKYDRFFRYTMPVLKSTVQGRGNGKKTSIINCTEVAAALDRQPSVLTKFFGYVLGTTCKWDGLHSVINGAHETRTLQRLLSIFIDQFVLCPNCLLPETDLSVEAGTRSNIRHQCRSCGETIVIDTTHKCTQNLCKFIANEARRETTTATALTNESKRICCTNTNSVMQMNDAPVMEVQNFKVNNPFEEVRCNASFRNKVHIRTQQRCRHKCILTIQGLDDDLDLKRISKNLRRQLNCNGTVKNDKKFGTVVVLQGDHRAAVRKFLVEARICDAEQVIVH